MKVAILTPAYNREHTLTNLYESLINQTNQNFVWYVIDDGSKDNTKELINNFIIENKIKIIYKYKDNGGKHTALNIGLGIITEPITMIVDSDDYLTNDAIKTILNDWDKIKTDSSICGIGYLRYSTKNIIGKEYSSNNTVDTFINERYNKNSFGDKCEVFKTDILKQYPFPEFKGERFLSESTIWCAMSGPYKMLFINKGIYICEYLQGGLSDNVHKTLFKNPHGATACYKACSTKEFNLKNKCKFTLLYIVHSLAGNDKHVIKNSNNKILTFILFPFAYIIYLNRKRKYTTH